MIADFAKMSHNATTAAATVNFLNIAITDGTNDTHFKLKSDLSLGKVFDEWCRRWGVAREDYAFLHEGARLHSTDTPASVSLHHLFGLLVIDDR